MVSIDFTDWEDRLEILPPSHRVENEEAKGLGHMEQCQVRPTADEDGDEGAFRESDLQLRRLVKELVDVSGLRIRPLPPAFGFYEYRRQPGYTAGDGHHKVCCIIQGADGNVNAEDRIDATPSRVVNTVAYASGSEHSLVDDALLRLGKDIAS